MRRLDIKELAGGLLMCLIGLYFLVGAFDYEIGTPRRMGPGFFPLLVSSGIILVGLAIAATGIGRPGSFPNLRLRAMAAILLGILAFGVGYRLFGLIPAVAATVVTASFGDPRSRPLPVLLVAVGAAVGAWLIFIVGLGLQLPAIRI